MSVSVPVYVYVNAHMSVSVSVSAPAAVAVVAAVSVSAGVELFTSLRRLSHSTSGCFVIHPSTNHVSLWLCTVSSSALRLVPIAVLSPVVRVWSAEKFHPFYECVQVYMYDMRMRTIFTHVCVEHVSMYDCSTRNDELPVDGLLLGSYLLIPQPVVTPEVPSFVLPVATSSRTDRSLRVAW